MAGRSLDDITEAELAELLKALGKATATLEELAKVLKEKQKKAKKR